MSPSRPPQAHAFPEFALIHLFHKTADSFSPCRWKAVLRLVDLSGFRGAPQFVVLYVCETEEDFEKRVRNPYGPGRIDHWQDQKMTCKSFGRRRMLHKKAEGIQMICQHETESSDLIFVWDRMVCPRVKQLPPNKGKPLIRPES